MAGAPRVKTRKEDGALKALRLALLSGPLRC